MTLFGITFTPEMLGQIAAAIVGVVIAMLGTAAIFMPRFSKQQLDIRDLDTKLKLNKAETDKSSRDSDLANEQLIRTMLSDKDKKYDALLADKDKKYDDLNSNFLMLIKEFSDLRINLIDAKNAVEQRDHKITKLEDDSRASDKQQSENVLRITQLESQVKDLIALSNQMKAREESITSERDGIKVERDTLLKDQSMLLQRVERLEAQVKQLEGELLTNKQAAEAEKRTYELQISGLVEQLNTARSNLAALQKPDVLVTQPSALVPVSGDKAGPSV